MNNLNEKEKHYEIIVLEKEKFKKAARKKFIYLISLICLLVIFAVISFSVGASSVNFKDFINVFTEKIFGFPEMSDVKRQIVWAIRMPRVCAAILAGMSLSASGILMQGIFQNALVSPYTLGVSNGAAFGASVAIIFGYKTLPIKMWQYVLPAGAFIFAIFSMILVYFIATLAKDNTKTLILSGVAVGYLFSALVASMKYISDVRELPELVFWTMGGLSNVSWLGIVLMFIASFSGFLIMMRFAWELNVMSSGEETALSLGVNYKFITRIFFVTATLMTATAVSFTGVIGFVGLIAPHITTMLFGGDYRYNIPASCLLGALLLLLSDTLSRIIIAPSELPVGVITSLIGVPFFIYLIIRRKR